MQPTLTVVFGSQECLEIFTRCAEAHKILSDPLKRALYDISAGIRVATPEEVG